METVIQLSTIVVFLLGLIELIKYVEAFKVWYKQRKKEREDKRFKKCPTGLIISKDIADIKNY